jgi:FixJ family two-component response regulator
VVSEGDDAIAQCCSRVGRGRPDLCVSTLISIIDDDEDYRVATMDLIQAMGFTVEAFPSAVDFLASPNVPSTACLIADVHMPRMTGPELNRHLVESGYAIPMILITAYPDDSARALALSQGVICYLSKPCDGEALLECVRSALRHARPDQNPP